MPIDASIPLMVKSPQELQQMEYRNQLAQMQMQQAQQERQQNNALLGIMKEPGALGENGMPTQATMGRIMQANPEAGFKMQNQLAVMEENRQRAITNTINQRLLGMNIGFKEHDLLIDIATTSQERYEDLIRNGTPKDEAARIAGKERNDAVSNAQKSGLLGQDQANQLQGPFNPETNRAFVTGSAQYKRVLDEQRQTRQELNQEVRTGIQERREQRMEETAGETPFMKEAAATYGKGTPEYTKAVRDHLAKESGTQGVSPGDPDALENQVAMARSGMARNQVVAGWGKEANSQWSKITSKAINQIMDENPGLSRADAAKMFAGEQMGYKANQQALTQNTKDLATIRPFKNMLDKNVDIAIGLSKKVVLSNSKFANKTINWVKQNSGDNPDTNEYLAQIAFVQTEAARVLNNPRLSGTLSDSARHEMQQVISGDMPINSTERVLNRIKQDGENRVQALEDEHEALLSGGGESGGKSPKRSLKAKQVVTGEGGVKYKYKGGDPADRNSWERTQ